MKAIMVAGPFADRAKAGYLAEIMNRISEQPRNVPFVCDMYPGYTTEPRWAVYVRPLYAHNNTVDVPRQEN